MAGELTAPWRFPYWPTERQREAHRSNAEEMLFGGAAGGGKSFYLIGYLVTMCLVVPGIQVVVFRRSFPDLKRSIIQKLTPLLPPQVAKYNSQDKAWNFANGSRLEVAYLRHENDVYNYQGAEYGVVAFDELTQFTEAQYKYLLSRVRVGGAMLERMTSLGLIPRMIATANPGGLGHHWVKARFIDPAPAGEIFQVEPTEDEPEPLTRHYIKSLLTDNPYLDQERYTRTLQALDPVLRRALLTGDWNVIEGVRFNQWRENIHVIKPSDLPLEQFASFPRAIGVDYGFGAPFAGLWGVRLGDGLILIYREAYEKELTATQQAELLMSYEADWERVEGRRRAVVMDPSMWRRNDASFSKTGKNDLPPEGSPAYDYMKSLKQIPEKAVNNRGHGWSLLDEKLRVRGDGFPRILVYDTCRELIRTLPALPRDKKNPEDIDTHAEDHLADALRYLLMYLEGRRVGTQPHQGRPDAGTLTQGIAKAQF